jgi:hypothetical protein
VTGLLCYLQQRIYFRLPRRCPASLRLSAAVAIISPALRAKCSSSIGAGGAFAPHDGSFIEGFRRFSEGRVGIFFWRTDLSRSSPCFLNQSRVLDLVPPMAPLSRIGTFGCAPPFFHHLGRSEK